jgi:hypothetical protein
VFAFWPSQGAEWQRSIRNYANDSHRGKVTRSGLDQSDQPRAFKYYGYCKEASTKIRGEYQVASMLISLFMEVEHPAIYKPAPELKAVLLEPGSGSAERNFTTHSELLTRNSKL